MTGIFIRKTSGMPGMSHAFLNRTVGHRIVSVASSDAPLGMSAIRRCPSVTRSL